MSRLEEVIDGLNATAANLTTKVGFLRGEVVRVEYEAIGHSIEADFKIFR